MTTKNTTTVVAAAVAGVIPALGNALAVAGADSRKLSVVPGFVTPGKELVLREQYLSTSEVPEVVALRAAIEAAGDTPEVSVAVRGLNRSTARCVVFDLETLEAAEDAALLETARAVHVQGQETGLARENAKLKKLLADKTVQDDAVRIISAAALRHKPATFGKWAKPSKGGKVNAGVAHLVLSDLHVGEEVNPLKVEGMNQFDMSIAKARVERTFSKAMEMAFTHMSGATFDAAVVPLLGDLLGNTDIHEELVRFRDASVQDAFLDLSDWLVAGISMMAKEFPEVYVPCVVGNHGRMDKKPSAKGGVVDNFDSMLCRVVERRIRALHDNVEFAVSPSADFQYSVYGKQVRITHGDQFKGGSGVGGIWPSLLRGVMRKHSRLGAKNWLSPDLMANPEAAALFTHMNTPFDYLVMGHFHQYGSVQGVMLNGSLKGYDEYAITHNFAPEPAQQAMFVMHPEYGVTFQMPVLCDQAPMNLNRGSPVSMLKPTFPKK